MTAESQPEYIPEPPSDFGNSSRGDIRDSYSRNAQYSTRQKSGYSAGAEGLADPGRQMPQNIDAEKGVLGGMIMSKNAIGEISTKLTAQDFFKPQHQMIYEAITDLYNRTGEDLDPVLLGEALDKKGILEKVGGAPYLIELVEKTPTAANANYYANIVREKSVMRDLISTGTRVVQYGYQGAEGDDVESLVDMAQQEMFQVGRDNSAESYQYVKELGAQTLDELRDIQDNGGSAGLMTGFRDLDSLTNGLHPGQMVIIAARPGVGKSTLAMDIMRHASLQQNQTSVLYSLEMSGIEVMKRIYSAEAEVRIQDMGNGKLTDKQWDSLHKARGRLEDAPMIIDYSADLNINEIRAKSRRIHQKEGLGLIVVDYLQLLSSSKRVESRQQEVSEFSRQLKNLAMELQVPLIAISQLNRDVENRTGAAAVPRLSDLRESGSLEQDADLVLMLSRPDATEEDSVDAGTAQIHIAKNRRGPTGAVTVVPRLMYSRFQDFAKDPERNAIENF